MNCPGFSGKKLFIKRHTKNKIALDYRIAIMTNDLSNPQTLFDLGEWYYENGYYEEAKDRYQRALDLDPRCHITLNNLSGAHYELGEFHDALEYMELAISINPKSALYHFNLASTLDAFDGDNSFEDIISSLTTAIELDPQFGNMALAQKYFTAKEIRNIKFKSKKAALPWLFVAVVAGAGISGSAQQTKKKTVLQAQRINS